MKRITMLFVFVISCMLLFSGVALADSYDIPVTVDGKPITLTIDVANSDLISITSSTNGVVVGAPLVRSPVHTKTTSVTTTIVLSDVVDGVTVEGANTYGAVKSGANLRSSPSISDNVKGTVKAGRRLTIVGRSDDGKWLHLDSGLWISASLVSIDQAGDNTDDSVYPITSIEQYYMSEMARLTSSYLLTFKDFKSLLDAPQTNPKLLSDTDWFTEIYGYSLIIEALYLKPLGELLPSARLRSTHDLILEGKDQIHSCLEAIMLSSALTGDEYIQMRIDCLSGFSKISTGLEKLGEFEKHHGK